MARLELSELVPDHFGFQRRSFTFLILDEFPDATENVSTINATVFVPEPFAEAALGMFQPLPLLKFLELELKSCLLLLPTPELGSDFLLANIAVDLNLSCEPFQELVQLILRID